MSSPAASFILGAIDGYRLRQNMADAKTRREEEAEDRVWRREDRELARQDRERRIAIEDSDRARRVAIDDEKLDAWRADQAEREREREEAAGDRKVLGDAHKAAKASQKDEAARAGRRARSVAPARAADPQPQRAAIPAPDRDPAYVIPGSGLDRAATGQPARPAARSAAPTPEPAAPSVDPSAPMVEQHQPSGWRAALSALNPVGAAHAAEAPAGAARSVAPAPAPPSAPDLSAYLPGPSPMTGEGPIDVNEPPILNAGKQPYGTSLVNDAARVLRDANRAVDRNLPAEVAGEAAKTVAAGVNTAINPAVRYATGGSEFPVPETKLGTLLEGGPGRSVRPTAAAPNETSGGAQAAAPAGTPAQAAAAAPQAAAAPTPRNAGQGPTREAAARLNAAPVPSAAPDPATAVTPSIEAAAAASPAAPRSVSRSIDPGLSKDAPEGQRTRSFMTHYRDVAAPKVVDHYLSTGRVAEAEAFQAWIDDSATKAGMESWAKGVFAASRGDDDAFMSHMMDAYDSAGYYDDGYTIDRKESGFIRNDEGGIIGAKITLRDRAGQVSVQEFEGIEDIYQFGINFLSPEAVFEQAMQAVAGADAARAEERKHQRALELRRTPSGGGGDEFEKVWDDVASSRLDWGQLSADEKEATVLAELDARQSARGAYAQRSTARRPVDGMVQ